MVNWCGSGSHRNPTLWIFKSYLFSKLTPDDWAPFNWMIQYGRRNWPGCPLTNQNRSCLFFGIPFRRPRKDPHEMKGYTSCNEDIDWLIESRGPMTNWQSPFGGNSFLAHISTAVSSPAGSALYGYLSTNIIFSEHIDCPCGEETDAKKFQNLLYKLRQFIEYRRNSSIEYRRSLTLLIDKILVCVSLLCYSR